MAIPPSSPSPDSSGPVPVAPEPSVPEPPVPVAPEPSVPEPPAPMAPEPAAPAVAPGTGFARPEAGPAVPAPSPAPAGYPAQPAQPAQPMQYGYPAPPAGFGPPSPYGQPPASTPYGQPAAPRPYQAQGPQAPGYYPQQSYYAPGWTAPAEAATPRRSHTRLFLGLAIGFVVLLLIAGGIAWFLHWQQTRSLGHITSETGATAQQVETGHCIAHLPADGSVGRVTLVPCTKPHDAQVVGTNALQQDQWPGQSVVDDTIGAWCEMDSASVALGFQAVVWTPSESSWAQGDRRGVCIAWHKDGPVTGSLEDGTVKVP